MGLRVMSPLKPLLARIRPGFALLATLLCFVTPHLAEAARGRPYINAAGTTFVTDNGGLLRGAIISTETGFTPSVSSLNAIKEQGLNTVHCYAERSDYGYAAGARASAVDTAVQRTRDAGLYIVITIGNGGVDAAFVSAFWNIYAARYASETHVLYEIKNEPAGGPPVSAAVIQMEQNAYSIIRAAAPHTPIILMSYTYFQNGPGVLQDIAALGSGIDWSNAAIGFHGYGERGAPATRACLEHALDAGYACMQTEFYLWPWGTGNFNLVDPPSLYQDVDQTGDLERLGVSWLSFLPLSRAADHTRFRNRLNHAGIAWTPDFGSWPAANRGVYGNGGEPRPVRMSAATRIQAEDFDTGGQGVAYNDNSGGNYGNQYRTSDGVDVQPTSDTGGGHNIGWMVAGEWLEYATLVVDPGRYDLRVRVASPNPTGALRVKLAGVDLTGSWTFNGTGGNQTWTTLSKTVDIPPGQQVLRLEVLTSGFNLNWIELAPATAGPIPNGTYSVLSRASLKAMDVVNASTANGAKVQQWSYAANPNQKWVLTHRGANQYTITSAHTGKALDIASNVMLQGDHISMWPSKTTPGQRWIVTETDSGYHKLIAANSGLTLEIAAPVANNGSRVVQSEYTGATHQQWLLVPDQPSLYSSWTQQEFPLLADRSNPAVSGPAADPLGHGVANLLRYALGVGLNQNPAPRLPRLELAGPALDFRFPFDPTLRDITYRVEASNDLQEWNETVFDSRLHSPPPLLDGWLKIAAAAPTDQAARRFLRLRVLMNE